jgi:hypothetical protein
MRLVCIDHYFEQDIEGLKAAAGEHRCWAVDYEPFLALARDFFPEEVFTGIEAYFKPEYAAAREAHRGAVEVELTRLHDIYRFDALLAPSDTFFWIRPLILAAQDAGIPFIVLQKEATIPPGWIEGPAQEWGQISPFIADHMLVSSEHHRDFWVNSGVRPDQITVTGQPRFDIYARRQREPRRSGGDGSTVLFLTYDSNAYLPVIDRTGLEPWRRLRAETEAVLLELAREGIATVQVKAHPQPAEDQTEHLEELGREPGVEILDPRGDVRHYILDADIVVGFQTTALLEALAAGRPSVYTWWTDEVARYEADLIPFHREKDALVVAESPSGLRRAFEASIGAGTNREASELVTRYLGPIDGRAAERCWDEIERLVRAAPRTTATPRRLRAAVSAAAAAAAWTLASGLLPISYRGYRLMRRSRGGPVLARRAFRDQLQARRRGAVQRLIASSTR